MSASDDRVLWVTGAGSGIGRAAAVAAAAAGISVVVSGRRVEALRETARLAENAGGSTRVLPLDVRDPEAVQRAYAELAEAGPPVSDLVLAAGANVPQRSWADLTMSDVQSIVATNLTATVAVIDAALPALRARGGGQVVVVSSYAAWRFAPHAGVAYSASKTALAAVCGTLNVQEAAHGVRACHLCPGDVDTDFLSLRPQVPDAAARAVMLSPDDVARAVLFVLTSPPHVRVDELVISPVTQA